MSKRNLAVFLWFLVGWQFGGVLAELAALPPFLGFVPAVGLALIALSGRFVLFSPRSVQRRTITPINEYAAALDRKADRYLDKRVEQWPVVEANTKRS